ncbi:MAG: hypothetical protein FJX72_04020 [Armatimonadetes bacterium]|nr:hypothetical protein [Armatimonadota bacterium]
MNSKASRAFASAAAAVICVAAASAALAQQTTRGSAVIHPVVFSRNSGAKGSRATALKAVREALQKAGYTLVSDTVAANTWKRLRLPAPTVGSQARAKDLARFGKAAGARYVVAPVFGFHSRSIWVDLGPKTVSAATVGIVITDTQTGNAIYTRKNVQGRSDEKFDPVKAGADILVSPLVTVVSGGPKTPQEQRAVQIAVAKALKDWVKPATRAATAPSGTRQ